MSLFFLGAGGALIWTILIYSKFKVSRGQRDNGPSFIDSLSLSPFTLRPTWQYSQEVKCISFVNQVTYCRLEKKKVLILWASKKIKPSHRYLCLSKCPHHPPLQEVFDHDIVLSNDLMCEAEINLQP
ncbi:uncharacterized protein LOC105434908 [Cucumis sativus]|nr:uncharacterized protein LOC105434908 [Cucumis sativus]KAE8649453.1 hypothetical protein Csa_018872 [Cucumis sativus]